MLRLQVTSLSTNQSTLNQTTMLKPIERIKTMLMQTERSWWSPVAKIIINLSLLLWKFATHWMIEDRNLQNSCTQCVSITINWKWTDITPDQWFLSLVLDWSFYLFLWLNLSKIIPEQIISGANYKFILIGLSARYWYMYIDKDNSNFSYIPNYLESDAMSADDQWAKRKQLLSIKLIQSNAHTTLNLFKG